MKRLLREPLIHFLLIGAAMFASYQYLQPAHGVAPSSNQIQLSLDDLAQLATLFQSQWRRDPTPEEFGRMVETTIGHIEAGEFLPHSGIRFPQNPCSSCPYVGLCLGKQEMADARLVRRPGAEDLGWLDELNY